jgi:DNA relaxase NicK
MLRFDAYSATMVGPKTDDLLQIIMDQVGIGGATFNQSKGFHTFGHRLGVKDHTGSEVGAIQWGGRQGERLMFEVKGDATPGAVEALRARFPHRVTRMDSCADFDAPGAFERLLGPCTEVKKAHRLKGSKAGDWDDFPEDGRTFYVGSPKSITMARLYEKGKQPEYRHLHRENWTRLEIQVRPAKDAKAAFSHLSPVDAWGASGWTRELAAKVLQEHVDAHPAGTVYRLSEQEAALRWMCKQYGAHLVGLAQDLGNWECVGLTIQEMISAQAKGR